MIAKIYAELIRKGLKTIDDIPWRRTVSLLLRSWGLI